MTSPFRIFFIGFCLLVSTAFGLTKGFSLTELGTHQYDAALPGAARTEAQIVVDRLYNLGVRHIILTPRAYMTDPRDSHLTPATQPADQPDEAERYLRLVQYIHSRGMTVGIRPIFLVVRQNGQFPFVEEFPDGTQKVWWHGNIEPAQPLSWFASFQQYLDVYLPIAAAGAVEEFTLGAELESMTVGLAAVNPLGYAAQWTQLARYVRSRLPKARLMYDINYTDLAVFQNGKLEYGGEFARWRHLIADPLTISTPDTIAAKNDVIAFWNALDGVGLDMYRSLAWDGPALPTDYEELVQTLMAQGQVYALELKDAIGQINAATGLAKNLTIKEIGYRSVQYSFIDPFQYAGTGLLDLNHQAAAYEAFFRAFQLPRYPWYDGVAFWDASVDLKKHGPFDLGFSIVGKAPAEAVVSDYFSR